MISKINDIISLVNKCTDVKSSKEWVNLGKLQKQEVDKIYKQTGLDLTGYSRVLTLSEVKHILKHHGVKSDDKRPIGLEDFLIIPFIMANPDKIVMSSKLSGTNKLEVIKYYKVIGQEYVIVEEVRTGRRKMAIISFYKKKKPK